VESLKTNFNQLSVVSWKLHIMKDYVADSDFYAVFKYFLFTFSSKSHIRREINSV